MDKKFKTIALVGRPRDPSATTTHQQIYNWLKQQGRDILVEDRLIDCFEFESSELASLIEIGQKADLAIVIGGDGNMLGAARVLSRFEIYVIGVNRGNLGFLTDLAPDNFEKPLLEVLSGECLIDHRYLLECEIHRHNQVKSQNSALNEVVLHPCKIACMIEFEVYIVNHFAFSQRSDGLIISTQTGSTAYSLSGGGKYLSSSSKCYQFSSNVSPYLIQPPFGYLGRTEDKTGGIAK